MFLDYGADSDCESTVLDISRHGLYFTCKWRFEVGTHLKLSIQRAARSFNPPALRVEGIVVECTKTENNSHRVALLFCDITKDELTELRKTAALLAKCVPVLSGTAKKRGSRSAT